MIKKLDHLVITTKDFDKCKIFYMSIGFKAVENMDRLELFAGDFKINVHKLGNELSPHAKCVKSGSADLCFEVENLDKFRENLVKNCIDIELDGVERKGVRGKMKSLYIRDMDGNLLEFCDYAKN